MSDWFLGDRRENLTVGQRTETVMMPGLTEQWVKLVLVLIDWAAGISLVLTD